MRELLETIGNCWKLSGTAGNSATTTYINIVNDRRDSNQFFTQYLDCILGVGNPSLVKIGLEHFVNKLEKNACSVMLCTVLLILLLCYNMILQASTEFLSLSLVLYLS